MRHAGQRNLVYRLSAQLSSPIPHAPWRDYPGPMRCPSLRASLKTRSGRVEVLVSCSTGPRPLSRPGSSWLQSLPSVLPMMALRWPFHTFSVALPVDTFSIPSGATSQALPSRDGRPPPDCPKKFAHAQKKKWLLVQVRCCKPLSSLEPLASNLHQLLAAGALLIPRLARRTSFSFSPCPFLPLRPSTVTLNNPPLRCVRPHRPALFLVFLVWSLLFP